MTSTDISGMTNEELYEFLYKGNERFGNSGLNYEYPLFQRKEEILWCIDTIKSRATLNNVVEVGSLFGANLPMLSRAIERGGTIIGIEPGYAGRLNVEYVEELLTGYRFLYLRNPTTDAFCMSVLDYVLDMPTCDTLFFIDGFHSYDEVHRDWELIEPRCASGSVIVFHDLAKDGPMAVYSHIKLLYPDKCVEFLSDESLLSITRYGDRAWGGVGIYFV